MQALGWVNRLGYDGVELCTNRYFRIAFIALSTFYILSINVELATSASMQLNCDIQLSYLLQASPSVQILIIEMCYERETHECQSRRSARHKCSVQSQHERTSCASQGSLKDPPSFGGCGLSGIGLGSSNIDTFISCISRCELSISLLRYYHA